MNNKSPIPVKWAGSSLSWALSAEVWTWCHSELYLCLIFLTTAPPPKRKDTLTYIQTLVSATQACSSYPPPTFLPFPLPCQHKPVMWLSEIMRWEFYCGSLWAWHQSATTVTVASEQGSLVVGALCWLLWAHTACTRCSVGPASSHFKVGDQGLTCAWHPENDNASASLHLL